MQKTATIAQKLLQKTKAFPEKLLKATSSSGLSCFDALQLTDAKKEADGINKNQPIISKHYLNAGKLKRFKLAGTSKEHEFLRKLVGGKTVDSSELKKMKDCKTVQCAIAGIYGNKESGLRAFNIYYNDGYLLSVGSAEYPWKLEEVRNSQ